MITGVHLITGLIGSGKTLRAVWYIDQEIKAGRPVYACNINGLNVPGVIPFDDPRNWRDLPPGSLLVVDEAQRFWRARRAGEVPDELQEMETSRHDGVSFLVLTQQPTYLDKHLRGLVTRHEHLFRRMGAPGSTVYSWERCHDDPMCQTSKEGADESLFTYPKHLFGAYKSAEVHTVKFKLGTRGKLFIAAAVLCASVVGWLAYSISTDNPTHGAASAATTEQARIPAQPEPRGASTVRATTAFEYVEQQTPRVPTQPWSAPLYDGQKAVAKPMYWCLASGEGADTSCTCLTEQGTRYRLSEDESVHQMRCRNVARYGPAYNPFKAPQPASNARGVGGVPPTAMASRDAAPSPGAAIDAPQVSGYGDILAVKPEAAL